MGTISRPQKTGGNRTYVAEVDAGHTDIIDHEVDEDFRTIYDEFNGNITDANVRAAAGIVRSKLDFGAGLVDADIAPNAAIQWTKIQHPPTTIDTGELKLDAATQWAGQIGANAVTLPYPLNDSLEHTICTITAAPASRGGLIFMVGMFSGWAAAPGTAEIGLYARLYAAGAPVGISTIILRQTSTVEVPYQVSCISLPRGVAGSTGPFTLTAQLNPAGGAFIGTTALIQDAQLVAFELA